MKNVNVQLKQNSKMYSEYMNDIGGKDKAVLDSMLRHMQFNMNTITMNGDTLRNVISDTKLSVQQIRNAVSRLKKTSLIEASGLLRAEYIVNPAFAFKGNENMAWKAYTQMEEQRRARTIMDAL